ncbi:Folliculin [Armadillidium vulgare]|nr:Folliculin [Armadillidium vulgare]
MNAILSLCHFCELHGPKIIFTTQSFRDPPSISSIFISDELSPNKKNEEYAWKYGRIDKEEPLKSQPSSLTDTCSACRSFPHNKAAIITNDDENHVSFVSSQFPLQDEVFTSLRQAGIRSLSCEVYSEREGPIYFGDHLRGHVISYTFFLKDTQARGFLRRYSFLVMMTDKMFLLNSWAFFIKHIENIIKNVQECASKVYSLEEKQNSVQKGLKPPVASENSKRHRAAGNPRPLTDLVGDQNIWTVLHTKFTWILRVGSLRLQEKLVEGPPLYIPETEADVKLLTDISSALKAIVPLYFYRPQKLTSSDEEINEISNIFTTSNSVNVTSRNSIFIVKIFPLEKAEGKENGKRVFHEVQIIDPFKLKSRPPQMVNKIFSLIERKRLSNSVLNLYFATLIDEWTNKVSIWCFINSKRQQQEQMESVLSSANKSSTSVNETNALEGKTKI